MIQDSLRQDMRIIARQLGTPNLEEQLARIPESEYGELAKKLLLQDTERHHQRLCEARRQRKTHEL